MSCFPLIYGGDRRTWNQRRNQLGVKLLVAILKRKALTQECLKNYVPYHVVYQFKYDIFIISSH